MARAPSALYKASSCQSEELFEGARLWPVLMMCDHCRAPPADWKFQRRVGDLSPTQLGSDPCARGCEAGKSRAAADGRAHHEQRGGGGSWSEPSAIGRAVRWIELKVGAMTINKVCGSGLKAVALAAQAIEIGNSSILVARERWPSDIQSVQAALACWLP